MKRNFNEMNSETLPEYFRIIIEWILNFKKDISNNNLDINIKNDETLDDIDSDNLEIILNKYIIKGFILHKKTDNQLYIDFIYNNNIFNITMMSKHNLYKISCNYVE